MLDREEINNKIIDIEIMYNYINKLNDAIKFNGTVILEETIRDKVLKMLIINNDVSGLYNFAYYVKDAPIELIADIIIETKKTDYIFRYAKNVKDAPINKLANAIIISRQAGYIYEFAHEVKNAPICLLADAIIATKNIFCIRDFACNIKNTPIYQLTFAAMQIIATEEEELLENEIDIPRYIYEYAKNVENAPIELLTNSIIRTRSTYYIYLFACEIKNAPIYKLTNAIIKIHNFKYIYEFALNVHGAPIKILSKAITKADPEMIIKFACNIEGAPIELLTEAIIKTNKSEYIYKFASSVKGINLERLAMEIEKIGNPIYIYKIRKFCNMDITIPENLWNKESDYQDNILQLLALSLNGQDKKILNKIIDLTLLINPMYLIKFINDNNFIIKNYNSFSLYILNYMRENIDKYQDFLSVYIDCIIKPDSAKLKFLDIEYNNLMPKQKILKNQI